MHVESSLVTLAEFARAVLVDARIRFSNVGIHRPNILAQRREAGVEFVVEPHTRYEGELNEPASMILLDPSGNVLELEAFGDFDRLFAVE